MMKLLFAFILLASITSCKSKSAYKYSQDIVSKERSLVPEMTSTEEKATTYVTAGQFDSLAILAEKMEKLVQQKIDEINAMPVPDAKEVDQFKNSSLDYFKFIKSLYTSYKELGNASSDEERQEVLTDLQSILNNKFKVAGEMQAAQKKYADANNFKVESK